MFLLQIESVKQSVLPRCVPSFVADRVGVRHLEHALEGMPPPDALRIKECVTSLIRWGNETCDSAASRGPGLVAPSLCEEREIEIIANRNAQSLSLLFSGKSVLLRSRSWFAPQRFECLLDLQAQRSRSNDPTE
jgi:hypothetical protein